MTPSLFAQVAIGAALMLCVLLVAAGGYCALHFERTIEDYERTRGLRK